MSDLQNPFAAVPGGVLSADIAVPDHEQQVAFYASVLTTGEPPLWRADLMNQQGTPIIGLGPRTEEYDFLPLQWMPHFQVSDITASVAAAVKQGGHELMHAQTDDGQSQWAVLSDPAGAAFGLIPVVAEAPPDPLTSNAGRIAWLSLAGADPAALSAFYGEVIGWSAATDAGSPETTLMLLQESTAAAEIRLPADGVPAVWLIHLSVGDLAESLRRVKDGGGEVLQTSQTEPHRAVVRDPLGVCFALQQHRSSSVRG